LSHALRLCLQQQLQLHQTWCCSVFVAAQPIRFLGRSVFSLMDPVHLCDRILFFDDNSSNIDFIGLIATIFTILILFVLSLMVTIIKIFKDFMDICYNIYLLYRPVSSWAQVLRFRRQTRPKFPQSQFWHWWRDNRFHGRYPQANEDIDLDKTRLSSRLQSIRQAPQADISQIL